MALTLEEQRRVEEQLGEIAARLERIRRDMAQGNYPRGAYAALGIVTIAGDLADTMQRGERRAQAAREEGGQ